MNDKNAGETLRSITLWRARSSTELSRLRMLIGAVEPVALYCTIDHVIIVVPKTDDTVQLIALPVAEYPCIEAHVSYYGDAELLSLLCGHMCVQNLPKYLYNTVLPDAWFNFMLCFAELSAPGERPVNAPVPGWVIDEITTRDR